MTDQQRDYRFLSEIVASEKDLDIRAYTKKIKEELIRLEDDCITDFLTINKEVGILHSELNQSTRILTKIETVVDQFQNELSEIANQVSILQEKSQSYNTALKNRKELEKIMSGYIKTVVLTEEMITVLCNAEIDQDYLDMVARFNQILFDSKSFQQSEFKSMQEVKPELDKLRLKVCSRARSFLMVKINNLRKPQTNFQILQESVLLKFKPLLVFLKEHSQETFVEITNYYSDVMSKIYFHLIKTYTKESKKLISERITKHNLIVFGDRPEKSAEEDPAHKTLKMAKKLITNINTQIKTYAEGQHGANQHTESQVVDPFIIDERLHIIDKLDTQPQVSRISQQKVLRYPPEEIFRSQNKLIIEAVSKEFVFILEFFDLKVGQCSYIFNQVFSKIINYYLEWLGTYVQTQLFDIFAVLLMTIINDENKKYLHKNKLTVLDFFFEKVNMHLWPRFSTLLDLQIDSLKGAQLTQIKLYNQTIAHQSTMNYTDITRSLSIVAPYLSQDMLMMKLGSLRASYFEFLNKLAASQFQEEKERRSFIVNNIDYILQNFKHRQIMTETQDYGYFSKELANHLKATLTTMISEYFGALNELVKHNMPTEDDEVAPAQKLKDPSVISVKQVENIAQEFQLNYKVKLGQVLQEIKQSIQNKQTQTELFQKMLREVMLRFSSLVEIIKQTNPAILKEMTPPHLILRDIQYST